MMKQQISWYHWLYVMFKEFISETATQSQYEVVDIYECKKTGFT